MKLWGGRFTKETNQLVHNFNASLSFDQKFYEEDIEGSIAHVTMLAEQGILTNEDKEAIIEGLQSIRDDIRDGKLVFTEEHEDIHSFVEAHLIERIGDAGKRRNARYPQQTGACTHTERGSENLPLTLRCRDDLVYQR